MSRRRWGLAALCSALLLSLSALLVAAQDPSHAVSSFNYLPARLFFFDDTESVIYHDSLEGNIYVSLDEGRTFKLADGIPKGQVVMVFEHPSNNRYAFALTDGKTHYRTEDRGKTWRPFDVPLPPAAVMRPLSFHIDPKKLGYILYQGTDCERHGYNTVCRDETFYTKEAFSDTVQPLLKDTTRCQFAHSTADFKHEAHEDLIYCVAFDKSNPDGRHNLMSSRLYSSTDFFLHNKQVEDLGIGKNARGVVAFAIVSKFAVVALKDVTRSDGEMLLYVTVDTKNWAKAHFPHATSAQLRENAYTMLESTTHSLAVDVVLQNKSPIGTLFVSNSNGTYFVESLKDTNRNDFGYVDYERIYGVEGVGLANYVENAHDVETRGAKKKVKTLITFNDGSTWAPLKAPSEDIDGKNIGCDTSDMDKCALHMHSVTTPHNFGRIFSSPAPGFVMGVGSVGTHLKTYQESDTFLSTDAGLTWRMIAKGAHKYEFGDQGSILVTVDDEEPTDTVKYSLDLGKTWKEYKFGVRLSARGLVTLPDSTSQKFLLLGQVSKQDQKADVGKVVVVFLDFANTRGRKCLTSDFEKWYARPHNSECLMGHKQYYKRRKPDADCYVGEKYKDPVVHDENCECTEADFECDFNFVRVGDKCDLVGLEQVPPGVCQDGKPNATYKGSSGYRKISGDTCTGGEAMDAPVDRKCSQAQPPAGEVAHVQHPFPAAIRQYAYFKNSKTILVRLADFSIWQSSNEGYHWQEAVPGKKFLAFYHHKYSNERAYLITATDEFYYTTNTGVNWYPAKAENPPNSFGAQVIQFHPTNTEYLIWVGNRDCTASGGGAKCHAEAHYTRDNGRKWIAIDDYVRNCAFARDAHLDADPTEIVCEAYRDKKAPQPKRPGTNPLELVVGGNYYANKRKIFDSVVGFAKFSEFFVVAEMTASHTALELQVSLDGKHFSAGKFPPSMHPETHAYTILESSTKALFLHMTMSEPPAPYWGTILKSNSNGTYFGVSIENVNRNLAGYVDFEKMVGLDGIALINIVANPDEATHSGTKLLQSRITHNDGGTWTPLSPPRLDSLGQEYSCKSTKCALQIHGYTERLDPRAQYSSPSVPGLLMAVGNVGEVLAPYTESDTFLSRDAGFTWQEVHKDAHLWEFGDSGSILVMANDEAPTDFILYSTNEGLDWHEYKFSETLVRVRAIVTVPADTSRRFILFGDGPKGSGAIAIHVDFTALTSKKCVVNAEDPGHDDFELWSPAEARPEQCLFGRQVKYHRRVRNTDCVVGETKKAEDIFVENCLCTKADFECEFNHVRNANGDCELVPGTTPLPNDDSCSNGEDYWYERTAYRIIPYSSCEGGYRPDRGKEHVCPGLRSKSSWFWFFMLLLPFAFTALVGYYYYRRSGLARGTIRLPGDMRPAYGGDTGVVATLASVPWYVIGVAGIAYEWVASRADKYLFRSRRGYRNVPIDEDAQILRFEDEE
ncbi:vacuolar protein sorting/targeting protein 10 [Pholiota conissans]|uniref:Vacuolar protein sorting/targeting protein 10 n=1 Tax=Pholiota conissans TaxID=109636 RepID=A0A9P6CXL5_9AGAR|nr:vacuolar protein sorting/targeting protein 10 [Pholiota conissans]